MDFKIFPQGFMESNAYILFDDHKNAVIIDCGGFSDELKMFIRENALQVKKILLTHGHFDHIIGIPQAKECCSALVGISMDEAQALQDSELNLSSQFMRKPFQICSDFLFSDGDELTVGDIRLEVIATPGHTKGGVCFVWHDKRCVFTGDTLFYNSVGRTDLPGGSYFELKKSVQRLAFLPEDYAVYPGHDCSTTIKFEKEHNQILRN